MASKPDKKTAAAKPKKEPVAKAKKNAASKAELPAGEKRFLHIGCGASNKEQTTKGFNSANWHETRLDIDKSFKPDIAASMVDMSSIESESFDALFSGHSIQHLHIHEVPLAFAEFKRVLKPDGFAVISCSDLQSVGAVIAQNHLTATLYNSTSGPMTALDILYGHRPSVGGGRPHMAHHCGFTKDALGATLAAAGFVSIAARARAQPHYDLWMIATKSTVEKSRLEQLVADHFPV